MGTDINAIKVAESYCIMHSHRTSSRTFLVISHRDSRIRIAQVCVYIMYNIAAHLFIIQRLYNNTHLLTGLSKKRERDGFDFCVGDNFRPFSAQHCAAATAGTGKEALPWKGRVRREKKKKTIYIWDFILSKTRLPRVWAALMRESFFFLTSLWHVQVGVKSDFEEEEGFFLCE